jgi:dihydrolipoamide dehydrogenase
METKIPNFYAIGDCINTPWLAHVASAEGLLAVESIRNISNSSLIPIDYNKIPKCIYTIPSISWCGISEDEILISKEYVKISKFPLIKNGKAATMLEHHGFIKSITDKETNELLGIHILGKNSTELIAEPSFAMQVEATVEEITHTVHAHPTLYESIYEVALIALGKPLHG